MTDLAYTAMTDDELALRLEHAAFCLCMTQSNEARRHWMDSIEQLKQEQQRRTDHGR